MAKQTTNLAVTGMTCGNCVAHVTKALKAVKGVKSAQVELPGTATVTHKKVAPEALIEAIQAAGYEATVD